MTPTPSDVIYLYTNGLCWSLAVALHEMTDLPVWVVREADGSEVHAFVFDENTSVAYDIRGRLSVSGVISGPWENGKTISPWTRKIGATKCNIAKAKTVAKRYVMGQF